MADSITITCPECDKQFNGSEELIGRKVRCKGCGEVFVAKAPRPAAKPAKPAPAKSVPAKPAPAKPAKTADDDEDDGRKSYDVTDTDLAARCPHCANELDHEDDVICLTCGYNLMTRELGTTRKIADQTALDYFLWHLTAILCTLFIIALITWDILFCMQGHEWVKGDQMWEWVAHPALKFWNVLISLFLIWYAGKYAVIRFFLHPHPPEVEEG